MMCLGRRYGIPPRYPQDKIVAFCMTPRKRAEIAEYCGYKDVKHFTQNYLRPLIEEGRIVMTIPDKPNSKNQRYLSAGKK